MGDAKYDGCTSMPLWSERILAALPEDHPLAAGEVIYWTDLRQERILLSRRDPGPELFQLLVSKLALPGEQLNVILQDVSFENVKSLVSAGCGVSLMCDSAAGAACPGVVFCEVRDGSGVAWVGYSAYWNAGNDNPALRSFVEVLRERCPPIVNGSEPHDAPLRCRGTVAAGFPSPKKI